MLQEGVAASHLRRPDQLATIDKDLAADGGREA